MSSYSDNACLAKYSIAYDKNYLFERNELRFIQIKAKACKSPFVVERMTDNHEYMYHGTYFTSMNNKHNLSQTCCGARRDSAEFPSRISSFIIVTPSSRFAEIFCEVSKVKMSAFTYNVWILRTSYNGNHEI